MPLSRTIYSHRVRTRPKRLRMYDRRAEYRAITALPLRSPPMHRGHRPPLRLRSVIRTSSPSKPSRTTCERRTHRAALVKVACTRVRMLMLRIPTGRTVVGDTASLRLALTLPIRTLAFASVALAIPVSVVLVATISAIRTSIKAEMSRTVA